MWRAKKKNDRAGPGAAELPGHLALYLSLQSRAYAPTGPLRMSSMAYCAWGSLMIPLFALPMLAGELGDPAFLFAPANVPLFFGFAFISTALLLAGLILLRVLERTNGAAKDAGAELPAAERPAGA